MRSLRAVFKLLLILLATVFCYLMIVPGMLLLLIGLETRGWNAYFLSLWGKLNCKIMGLSIQVMGNPPKPPFFIVSNHLSYVDIMMLISQMPCLFVAKSEVLSWPLFGFMSRTVGMLFVDRSRKTDVKRVNDLISRNISTKQGILLFPEGTTSAGYEVMPFKASLLAFPAEQNMPVYYVTIGYSTPDSEPPAYLSVCWWGEMGFGQHFYNLLKLKEFNGRVTFGKSPVQSSDRKELASLLSEKVSYNFDPVIDYPDYAKEHISS